MQVTGTQHAAACFDSPDPFAGSGCVWVWGVGGVEALSRNSASPTRADGASCLEKEEKRRLGF